MSVRQLVYQQPQQCFCALATPLRAWLDGLTDSARGPESSRYSMNGFPILRPHIPGTLTASIARRPMAERYRLSLTKFESSTSHHGICARAIIIKRTYRLYRGLKLFAGSAGGFICQDHSVTPAKAASTQ